MLIAMAKRKRLLGPTTVRFPEDIGKWIEQAAAKHPAGAAGVIRDACHDKMRLEQESTSKIRNSLIGALE